MTRPAATVSVDVDPVDLHLVGYGIRDAAPDPRVYAHALPRLLERFAARGVRATLFVVARDAESQAASLRAVATAGHEIASHSVSHPLALARLPTDLQRAEFQGSRAALEKATGSEVIGFRAPNFDMNEASLANLAASGYRYDASGYPTLVLLAARLALAMRGGAPFEVLRLGFTPFTWRRLPHRLPARAGGIAEFPVTVSGALRVPVYHTLRYGTSDERFARGLDAVAARGEPLSYVMHAVDALGLEADGVDRRLGAHPGMDRPLAAKLDLLDRTLEAIAARFECIPFRDRLARGEPSS